MAEYKYVDNINDQAFWTTMYLNNRDLIELDYYAKIFLNCIFVQKNDIDYNNTTKVLTYSKTQTNPLMIHANGPDKSYLYNIIGNWN